jgi:hypothetical protein
MTEADTAGRKRGRNVALGCGGCVTAATGVALLIGLLIGLAFVRWPGDPVRFEVQLEGASLPASASSQASYRPQADIPFVTHGLLGDTYTVEVSETARAEEGWLTVELDAGWPSIRDERLHFVSMDFAGGSVGFSPISAARSERPRLRTSGDSNAREWADLEGDVATLRIHALFLPSSISYDARAREVRAIIDTRPIHAARITPESQITALPGVLTSASVRALTSGVGWPDCTRASGVASGTTVEAVIVSEDALLDTIGWAAGFTPYMPLDPALWRALVARADPRFAPTIEPTSDGATVRFTTPRDASHDTAWHLVAAAFAPEDALFGAAEVYLALESWDDEAMNDALVDDVDE